MPNLLLSRIYIIPFTRRLSIINNIQITRHCILNTDSFFCLHKTQISSNSFYTFCKIVFKITCQIPRTGKKHKQFSIYLIFQINLSIVEMLSYKYNFQQIFFSSTIFKQCPIVFSKLKKFMSLFFSVLPSIPSLPLPTAPTTQSASM